MLFRSVKEYLYEDLLPKNTGAEKWKLRIAVNALSLAIRELTEKDQDLKAYGAIMSELGVEDEAGLAYKIKTGELDNDLTNLHEKLFEIVKRKLKVANPSYMSEDSE